MGSSDTLHRLLYLALLEIREHGREDENKVVFHLADLFHNIPLPLSSVVKNERTYEEVLSALRAKARETGCDRWLDRRLAEVEARANQTKGNP